LDERDQNSPPPDGAPNGVSVDVSGELTAELGADQFVQNIGTSRIWSFRPEQVVAGRYRIIRTIGRGGMGEVYEAEDLELGGRVALKTIRAEAAAQETLLWRFRREIQIARRVTHPNVCRLFDVSYHTIEIVGSEQLTTRMMCVSMELLEGETLSQKLSRDGAMTPAEALPIARQLAEGLSAAHAAGVIHRDFKAANVMLVKGQGPDGPDGVPRAVITDFGLARRSESSEQDTSLTDSGVVVGTPAYMAPEQFEGKDASSASDIYSFGVVLYEMITGRKPFEGATPISQAIQRLKSAPRSPARFCEGLDPAWEAAILRCLESDPQARFATPGDVIAALEGQDVARGKGRSRNKTVRRQKLERIAAAAAVVALSAVAGFGLYKLATRPPQGASSTAEATPVIAVRPGAAVIGFKDLSGKPDSLWLSTAFAEMMRTELAAGDKLRLISGEDIARARHELDLQGSDTYSKETLERIHESLGADYVVAGSYVALGSGDATRLRFDVRVQDTRSGETITAISESGTEADLLAMVSSAGTKLRGVFGQGALDMEKAAGLAASRPQNPEVIRLYAEGLAMLRDFDALGARGRLEKAVALEPDFALGHAALAEAWSKLGYDKRAVEQAQLAFDVSKTLGREESLSIEGRLRAMQKDWKKAAGVYSVLHGFAPDSMDYGVQLAESRGAAGDHEGAKQAIRELRTLASPVSDDPAIDLADARIARFRGDAMAVARLSQRAIDKGTKRGAPLMVARAQILLGWAQRLAGKFTASVQTLESAKTTFAGHGDIGGAAEADIEIGHSHFYMGNYSAARARFEPARATCEKIGWRSCEALALNSLGGLAWVDGRYADGAAIFNKGVAIARETADKQAEMTNRTNIAEIYVYMGRSAEAWRESQALLAEIKAGNSVALEPAVLVAAGLARLQQGRVDEGRGFLDAALASAKRLGDPRHEAYALTKIAVAHFFDGSVDKAAADLEQAVAIRHRLGEKSPEAEAATRLAAVRIAQGRLDDAEAILPAARKVLADEHALIDWVYATSVTAELLLARGKAAEALAPIREIRQQAPNIEKPSLRIRVDVTEARVLAATGKRNEALSMLGAAIAEGERLDLPMESLGAALTLGELQLAEPATKARGVATVERARARARALGMKYFDHKAEQLLAGSSL